MNLVISEAYGEETCVLLPLVGLLTNDTRVLERLLPCHIGIPPELRAYWPLLSDVHVRQAMRLVAARSRGNISERQAQLRSCFAPFVPVSTCRPLGNWRDNAPQHFKSLRSRSSLPDH